MMGVSMTPKDVEFFEAIQCRFDESDDFVTYGTPRWLDNFAKMKLVEGHDKKDE
jgi:hypothetical protein